MSPTDAGPRETDAERLARAPNVLEAYARDVERHGRPLDSGLPDLLRFVAEQLRKIGPERLIPPTEISARAAAFAEAASIARDHAKFCRDEVDRGGHPSLRERANGVEHIAKRIDELAARSIA